MLINVTIQGTSPLLQHRFSEESERQVSTSKRASISTERDPRAEAEKVCYRAKDNRLYQPSTHIMQACRAAGKYHKIGRKQVDRLVMAGMSLVETELMHDTEEFEVDSRPVVIPSTKGRVMRHRPRLDNWKLSFTLLIDDGVFDENMARTLIDDAGRRIGIGDFRPERGGPFGRFVVIEWKKNS